MRVITKFRGFAYFTWILSISLLIGIIASIVDYFESLSINETASFNYIIFYITFVLIWLVFGELKNKFIIVEFSEDQVIVSKMGRIFRRRLYLNSEISGWKYSVLSSKIRDYEYLYLYRNGRKVVKISEQYHKNYKEVKIFVETKFTSLGFEEFSLIKEFKEIF